MGKKMKLCVDVTLIASSGYALLVSGLMAVEGEAKLQDCPSIF